MRTIQLVRGLLGLALVAGVVAPPRAGAQEQGAGDLCANLAYVFYAVAEYRESGRTREEQVRWVRENVKGLDPEATRRLALRIVDVVYRLEASPRALGALVSESCAVDEQGQAVLRLYPPAASSE